MDDKTKKALLGSIKKWEAIVAGTGEDDGENNCPLCELFHPHMGLYEGYDRRERAACGGCPVREKTKKPYCRGTPYIEWSNADAFTPLNGYFSPEKRTEYTKLAQAELDFLRSLLPEDE